MSPKRCEGIVPPAVGGQSSVSWVQCGREEGHIGPHRAQSMQEALAEATKERDALKARLERVETTARALLPAFLISEGGPGAMRGVWCSTRNGPADHVGLMLALRAAVDDETKEGCVMRCEHGSFDERMCGECEVETLKYQLTTITKERDAALVAADQWRMQYIAVREEMERHLSKRGSGFLDSLLGASKTPYHRERRPYSESEPRHCEDCNAETAHLENDQGFGGLFYTCLVCNPEMRNLLR